MKIFLSNQTLVAKVAAILGILGLADAVYLTINHYANLSAFCYITSRCDLVLTSSYAVVLGVPVALLGAVYYATVIGLSAWFILRPNDTAWRYLHWLVGLAFAFSLYLVYLQFFVIGSFCVYCMLSAILTAVMFILVNLA